MHPILNHTPMLALKAFDNPDMANPNFGEMDRVELAILQNEETDFSRKIDDINSWGAHWKNIKISLAAGACAGGLVYVATRSDNNGQGLFVSIFAAAAIASQAFQLTTHTTLLNGLDEKLKIVNGLTDIRISRLKTKIAMLQGDLEEVSKGQNELVIRHFSRSVAQLNQYKEKEYRENEQAHARLNRAREENHNQVMNALNRTRESFREQHAMFDRDSQRRSQERQTYEREQMVQRARRQG